MTRGVHGVYIYAVDPALQNVFRFGSGYLCPPASVAGWACVRSGLG